MFYNVHYKTKQFFFVLIKLSIVVGAFYFIYAKIVENENLQLNTFLDFLRKKEIFSTKNIIFLIILSIFNWFFEIIKWQHLVKTIKNISFKNALEQSLGGLTASLITPNRIGDYGAKAVYYSKGHRKKIVLLNLLGNMAQMTITTFFGVIGFIVFVNHYQIDIDYYKIARLVGILIILSLFVAFGLRHDKFKIKGFSLQRIFDFLKEMSVKHHAVTLLLSLIRYLIFSFQFYYLLTVFGVDVDYSKAMVVITSMYFLASLVPSISIFDVVIKGGVAVFLFGYVEVNELTILSITTIMWLLNFVVPSLFGSYYVLNFKLPKTEEE
ncbi:lysylphosphatidylglycerol synthase domain-containing protein [Winogradskyella ursingii]|uniref:lysylphosphatidylglycerol synthase domain-containing protein n=1 Tax=Winogradskyella ursingii TaxID=2686079 RepID=UPI0015CBE0B0|nr:lysylphosphatidylglycerol synthase domain-containing protein [Winogradskyella ursingii]